MIRFGYARSSQIVPIALTALLLGCSGDGGGSYVDTTADETCEIRTDLTRGTIDGPACEAEYEVLGKSDQSASFNMCTEYTFDSTSADEEGLCDQTNLLGRCVAVDERDPSLVRLVYVYADLDSTLSQCDQLKLKSSQCLNRPGDTWCSVQ
jgi:hypothetical protein